MLNIIDHNSEPWSSKYRSKNRQNGAYTYSIDIVKFYIPIIQRLLKNSSRDALVSTCGQILPCHHPEDYDVRIQWIHDIKMIYNYVDALKDSSSEEKKRWLFVVSSQSYAELLSKVNLYSVIIPLAIDAEEVRKYKVPADKNNRDIIYFGNVYREKTEQYYKIWETLTRLGWNLTTISMRDISPLEGHANPPKTLKIKGAEAWKEISRYKYGIGVGRCLAEMYALGLKCLVSGNSFGGIVMSSNDAKEQLLRNYRSDAYTFTDSIETALENLDKSLTPQLDIGTRSKDVEIIFKDQFKHMGLLETSSL